MIPVRTTLFLVLGSSLALAQVPPPGVPIPGQPANPAGAPAGAEAVPANLGETKIIEDITEPKLTGNALAGLYRKYTGRRVIVSAAAAGAEFSFIQEATQQDPLTYAEAAALLRKAATIENFVFVPDSSDPTLDILTLASGGIRPPARGLDVYNETDALPEGDAVISYVMALRYIKPDEAVRTFTQIVGQFGAYGSIAAVPNASAVIITENTSLIRKLIDLKKEIDKPSSQVATRFIKVQYADVTELATTLNEMLTAQQSAQKTAGIQRAEGTIPPAGTPAAANAQAGGTSSGEETPVQIVPDPRTNRIFAMGRPIDLVFVEGLIREFDTQTDQKNFLRRKLRFLKVGEFLPIAGDALTRAFSGTGTAAGGAAPAAGGNNRQQPQQNNSNNRQNTTSNNRSNTSGVNGGSSATSGVSSLGDPDVTTAPESLLVGRTLLVADNITNSIVVQGPPAGLEIVEKLLDQIDRRADQVMISCVFGQLRLTDGQTTGIDWLATSFNGSRNGGIAGSSVNGSTAIVPPSTITGLGLRPTATSTANTIANGFPGSTGLNLYGQLGTSLGAFVTLDESDSNFKVISRPTIFTANNQKGTIISGTQIAVPTSSYALSNSSTASTNYEYKDVALKLEVIPLVNSENEVTLQIYLTSDDLGQERDVGEFSIPDILKRELVTTVTVPNNQTIVLGGLITESLNKNGSGIPVLRSLPGVGHLFGTRSKSGDRSELLVFIQPSVVHDNRTLDDAQVDMDRRYKTSGDTRRFADGPGTIAPPDGIVPNNEKASDYVVPVAPKAVVVKPKSLRPVHRP